MALPLIRFEHYVETKDIEYFERLEMFLEVNGVKAYQEVARVLSDIDAKTIDIRGAY